MARNDITIERSPLNKDGSRRKNWSPGTAWVAIIWDDSGKRREFYGATRREADAKVGRWRRGELTTPQAKTAPLPEEPPPAPSSVPPAPLTAGEWLMAWAEDPANDVRWRARRRADVKSMIRLHVLPHWRDKPIAELTYADVRALLDRLAKTPTQRDKLRRDLSAAFRSEGSPFPPRLIPRRTALQRAQTQTKEETWRILSSAEWQRLEEAAWESSDPLALAVIVALETGIRSGELRGLQWADVSLTTRTLHVRRAVTQGDALAPDTKRSLPPAERRNALVFEPPKTSAADRSIALTPMAVDAFQRQRQRLRDLIDDQMRWRAARGKIDPLLQQQWALVTGEPFGDDTVPQCVVKPGFEWLPEFDPTELVWPALGRSQDPWHRYRNRPLDRARLGRVLDSLRQAADIPKYACPHCSTVEAGSTSSANAPRLCETCRKPLAPLRWHDLRHTNASHLLDAGLPQPLVLARLGWRSPAMLARYAHATDSAKDRAVAELAKIGGGAADVQARIEARRQKEEETRRWMEEQAARRSAESEDAD